MGAQPIDTPPRMHSAPEQPFPPRPQEQAISQPDEELDPAFSMAAAMQENDGTDVRVRNGFLEVATGEASDDPARRKSDPCISCNPRAG